MTNTSSFEENFVRSGQPSSQVATAATTTTNAAAYSLPQARSKIKLKANMRKQPTNRNMFNTIETNNCTRKPQGAFFFPRVTLRFLSSLLAVSVLILVLCILTADCAARTPETNSVHRHYLTRRQQRENQQKLQQNKLRYLIARTSLLPQWVGHQRHTTNHMDNNIINHNNDRSHPNSVHRIGSEASVAEKRQRLKSTNGLRREPMFVDRIHAEFQHSHHGKLSADDVDPIVHDFDSLDVDLTYPDVDDADDIDNDVDDDADVDDEEDDDVDEEDDEVSELDSEDYATLYDGDRINIDDLNTIPTDEEITNKKNRKSSHLRSALSNGQPRRSDLSHKSTNTSINNELATESSTRQFDEPLMRPHWGKNLHEFGPRSNGMVITTTTDQLEGDSYEQQPHQLQPKHKSQPLAPYQSPVVVSISDNSFVSASPISMGAISVNDGDVVEGPQSSERTTVHYSHIIASPKNELPSYGRRYWHDSHMASIQMVQEEHNELQQGGIISAIIAILFGIGVTGTLIMIVRSKMRSYRERVAYKGRRRSLVPDTDFLINTIPM